MAVRSPRSRAKYMNPRRNPARQAWDSEILDFSPAILPTMEIEVSPNELGASLCRLRICLPNALEQMELSFSRMGQLTPLQTWPAASKLELFDGLKRLRAAQSLS